MVFIVIGVIVGRSRCWLAAHRPEVSCAGASLCWWASLDSCAHRSHVVAGYPAYLALAGPQRPVGPPHPLAVLYPYHGDLLAPVLPTHGQVFSTSAGDQLVQRSVTENGYYVGVPLLLLLIFLAVRFHRVPLVRSAAAVAVVGFVFSLGTTLTVDNHRVLSWMPFRLIDRIPVIQQIEPARLSLLVAMAAAVVLGVGLDRWRAAGRPLAARSSERCTRQADAGCVPRCCRPWHLHRWYR